MKQESEIVLKLEISTRNKVHLLFAATKCINWKKMVQVFRSSNWLRTLLMLLERKGMGAGEPVDSVHCGGSTLYSRERFFCRGSTGESLENFFSSTKKKFYRPDASSSTLMLSQGAMFAVANRF